MMNEPAIKRINFLRMSFSLPNPEAIGVGSDTMADVSAASNHPDGPNHKFGKIRTGHFSETF
jgi:hypothetical protein